MTLPIPRLDVAVGPPIRVGPEVLTPKGAEIVTTYPVLGKAIFPPAATPM